ncbi:serine hydrolase, partial [bacterium]|nr:serine hydrolase [bacterium]
MKNLLFLLLLLFSFNSCNNKESLIYDSESLDSLVSKYVDNGSQALLLVRLEDKNGSAIYQNSVKNNKLVPDHIINKNTWFRIWSMSKIVTISITMDLVEDGLLSLNDPVSKY